MRSALVAKCSQALGEVFAAHVAGKGRKLCLKAVIAVRAEVGAREAFDLAAAKLPIGTRFVTRQGEEVQP